MPVYSMTGYATGQSDPTPETTIADVGVHGRVALEIRAVNSRFLDVSLRLPDELRAAEPALRECVAARVRRGKVELRAWIEQRGEAALRAPSAAELQRLSGVQEQVQAWLPQARGLSVAEVLQLAQRGNASGTDWREPLLTLAQRLLDDFNAAREREGARLVAMLRDRVAQLRALAEQAAPLVPQVVAQQRERFLQRFHDALGATPADPRRAAGTRAGRGRGFRRACGRSGRAHPTAVASDGNRTAARARRRGRQAARLLDPGVAP
jgi:uncharacterized protein (TIGR00255 family)